MATIKAYLQRAKEVRVNLLDESENIIIKNENKIVQLQTSQIDKGQGSDDQILKNANSIYSGVYQPLTHSYAALGIPSSPIAPKNVGDLYNFAWTGAFLSGLQIQMSSDKLSFLLFSTGTGSGNKKAFFDGYKNLFGLDAKNTTIVNQEILYPEILNYLNSKL